MGQKHENGEITPADENTLLLVKIMEDTFEQYDEAKVHPALCHLYCHALELSPFPERACQLLMS